MCDDKMKTTAEKNNAKGKNIEKAFMNEYNTIEHAFGKSFLDDIDIEEDDDEGND